MFVTGDETMKRTLLIGAALAATFAAAAPASAHYGGYRYRAPVVVRHAYRPPVIVRRVYRAPAYYTYPAYRHYRYPAYRYGYPRFYFSAPGFYFAF
jgi:hypothetical protein